MFKFEKLIFGDLGWGDEFLIATLMTIMVSICSMGLGIFIAIFAAWAKLTYNKFLKFIASFYTTVVRGIPELLVIYLIFFGGSAVVMKIAKLAREGKKHAEINDNLNDIIESTSLFLVVKDLSYIVKGGRLPKWVKNHSISLTIYSF